MRHSSVATGMVCAALLLWAEPAHAVIGGCCAADGTCVKADPGACVAGGGTYLGDGISCALADCVAAEVVACCLPDGGCVDDLSGDCTSGGGVAGGTGSDCASANCATIPEACCQGDGTCSDDLPIDCANAGGSAQGVGSSCAAANCPGGGPTVACCAFNGACTETDAGSCQSGGGVPQGAGSNCAVVVCAIIDDDACCLSDGSCIAAPGPNCTAAGGSPQGPGSDCSACPGVTVACCHGDGSCSEGTAGACGAAGGASQGGGSTCAGANCGGGSGVCCAANGGCTSVSGPVACPVDETYVGGGTDCSDCPRPTGACCQADGSCATGLTAAACAATGGIYQGHGTDCGMICDLTTAPCCQPDGSCKDATSGACALDGGSVDSGTTCADILCPRPTGGCCLPDGTCISGVSAPSCTAQGGVYQGDGTDCSQPCDLDTDPCCYPDGGCADVLPGVCADDGGTATAGTDCAGTTCPLPTGGCCLSDGSCIGGATASSCAVAGGVYQGDGSDCSEPCDLDTSPCCLDDGSCAEMLPDVCADRGGAPSPGMSCGTVTCPDPRGGCCYVDGSCSIETASSCGGQGGDYQGDGTDCTFPCPIDTVACCYADGSCQDLTASDCASQGGSAVTGASCSELPCPDPTGPCCFPAGNCADGMTASDCGAQGGDYGGDGSSCSAITCPVTIGACCHTDGTCSEGERDPCEASLGVYQGDGTTCVATICSNSTGACCFPAGNCSDGMSASDCGAQGGDYQGDGSSCSAITCPVTIGACCHTDGTCSEGERDPCEASLGVYQGDGTACAQVTCGVTTGACCYSDGTCAEGEQFPCESTGGVYQGDGTVCVGMCPVPEACCLPDGSCIEVLPQDCTAQGGTVEPGADCADDPCVDPTGACCLPIGACVVVTADDCAAQGGFYAGDDTGCLGDSNHNGLDDRCESIGPCEDCGPGPHWVDACPGGIDAFNTMALVGIDITLDCVAESTIVLAGPAVVVRTAAMDDSVNFPGLAAVDQHLDVIDTEMVALTLSGGGVVLRAGSATPAPVSPTLGAIVERPEDATVADSFFEVFVEIDLGGGLFVYNQAAMVVQSKITCLPPLADYLHLGGCVELWTSPVPGEGILVAHLVTAQHETFPGCGSLITGDCHAVHDTPFCNDEVCCNDVCAALPHCCETAWDQACVDEAARVCNGACCLPDGTCIEVPEEECVYVCGSPQSPRRRPPNDAEEIGSIQNPSGETITPQVIACATDDDLMGSSTAMRGPLPGVWHGPGSSCDEVDCCVADIDVDSNNNGVIDKADDKIEEEPPGKYVCLNDDDDNDDGSPDKDDTGPTTGEDDLVLMRMSGACDGEGAQWKLTFPANVKIWEFSDRSGPTVSGELQDFPIPPICYIEGVALGEADIVLTIVDAQGKDKCSDTIKVTVIQVDLDVDGNNDGTIDDDDDPIEEDPPGKYVCVNNDDDNGDGSADKDDTGPTQGEDDLVRMNMSTTVDAEGGKWKLTFPANINIWEFSDRSGPATSGELQDLPLPPFCYIEGISAGEATVKLTVTLKNGRELCHDLVTVTVLEVDLDVDSDNSNHTPDYGPRRTADEDRIEDDPSSPGKYVCVNDDDDDNDVIKDYGDGFDLGAGAEDDVNALENDFVRLVLELKAPIDPAVARLRFTYSDSDPAAATRMGSDPIIITSAGGDDAGNLRIWTKIGSVARDKREIPDGDFVAAETYDAGALGFDESNRTVTLWIEGISPSTAQGADRILVEVDPDGQGRIGFVCGDAVRTTVHHLDVDVDSDNDNRGGVPDRNDEEDAIEDESGNANRPGKRVEANRDDDDEDGIPDHEDGYDNDGTAGNEDDANTAENDFVQVVIEVPAPVDLSTARLNVSYTHSAPGAVAGPLRLWRKDGTEQRDKASARAATDPGDYVEPGEYAPDQLGLGESRTVTLYAEGVVGSAAVAAERIVVLVDPDGDGSAAFTCGDAARLTVIAVDADVDTDRDGNVEIEADDARENEWANDRGAIIHVNNDDDDDDDLPDNFCGCMPFVGEINPDKVINGAADRDDIAALDLQRIAALPDGFSVWLRIRTEDALNMRIFDDRTNPADEEVLGPNEGTPNGLWKEVEVPRADILAARQTYGVEALKYAAGQFSGDYQVWLVVRDGPAISDDIVATDEVRLKVAPYLLVPNTATPETIYFTDYAAGNRFETEMVAAVGAANVLQPPEGWCFGGTLLGTNDYEACRVDADCPFDHPTQRNCFSDPWTQDEWEIGFATTPDPAGGQVVLPTVFDLPRDRVLDRWGKETLMGPVPEVGAPVTPPNRKFFLEANIATIGDSGVYGGNIELAPPYTSFDHGRIVMGKRPDVVDDAVRSFLRSQRLQAKKENGVYKLIEPDTGWLSVAHIDEYLAFIPSGTGGNNAVGGAWRMVVADTTTALSLLQSLDQQATGTAEAGTGTTLTDNDATWTANAWQRGVIHISGGTGAGQERLIRSNTATAITIYGTWATNPDATSTFTLIPRTAFGMMLRPDGVAERHGVVTAAAATTLTDGNNGADAAHPNWTVNEFRHGYVRIVRGTGIGQVRRVASNTVNVITVTAAWTTAPDATSVYAVVADPAATADRVYWDDVDHPAAVTVYDLLHNTALATFDNGGGGDPRFTDLRNKQTQFQTKIDEAVGLVRDSVGLNNANVIALPQWFYGTTMAGNIVPRTGAAYWPGVPNMQVWNNTLLVPNPHGPRNAAGDDIFKVDVQTKLATGLGLTVVFIDVWDEYHVGEGETHCGSNIRRTPPTAPFNMQRWWEHWPED